MEMKLKKYLLPNRVQPTICLALILLSPIASGNEEDETMEKKPVPIAARQASDLDSATTSTEKTSQAPKDGKESTTKTMSVPSVTSSPRLPAPKITYDDETKALAQEVKKLQLEQSKLQLEHEMQLLKLQQEKEKISLENELSMAKQEKLLADLNTLKSQLELENTIHEQTQKQKFAQLQAEKEQLAMENAIQEERNRQEKLKFELEAAKLEFKLLQLNFENEQLATKISKRSNEEEWDSQVNSPKDYLVEPFVDGKLILSDRQIVLNGVIWQGTANRIVEKIQYFNNKSTEYPIFLVIEYCPGGSVMEGTRILKAMRKSIAPVYVVVKSLAASMAAVITTLAERSYSLPDAIFVHHQVWGISWGNRTEQREQLAILDEWSKRIMTPVAKKMGLTTAQLIEKMYENNSTGDWIEFANHATQYQWVDFIVEEIRDTSHTKRPADEEEEDEEGMILVLSEKESIDVQGQPYVKVPHLRPLDVYHLYNPDNYYRY